MGAFSFRSIAIMSSSATLAIFILAAFQTEAAFKFKSSYSRPSYSTGSSYRPSVVHSSGYGSSGHVVSHSSGPSYHTTSGYSSGSGSYRRSSHGSSNSGYRTSHVSYSAPAPTYNTNTYSAPSYSAPSYSAPSYSAPSYSTTSYSRPAAVHTSSVAVSSHGPRYVRKSTYGH